MPPTPNDPGDRLNSWKEIAAYLNRSVRTVIRWEAEQGLPVHRQVHEKRGAVHAYKADLNAWVQQRTLAPESAELARARNLQPRARWIGCASAGVILAAFSAWLTFRGPTSSS